jgi:hypothetical protein
VSARGTQLPVIPNFKIESLNLVDTMLGSAQVVMQLYCCVMV